MSTMEIILLALVIGSYVLHIVAPMTKNTYDDRAAEVIDEVKDKLGKK